MTLLTALRQVNSQIPGSTQARLIYRGYEPIESRLPLSALYLQFSSEFVDGSNITGYIDKADWLNQAVPALQGIDWLVLDELMMPSLIASHPLQLNFIHQHAEIRQSRIVEIVKDLQRLSKLPSLVTTAGLVLVESFGLAISNESADPILDQDLQKIPVPIAIELGQCALPLASLTKVEEGDVLLIEKMTKTISSRGKNLFKFKLEHESIMILEHNDEVITEELTRLAGGTKPTGNNSDLRNLPVELSIVLFEKNLTLGELKVLTPGEVLKLPLDAMMNVEIRANHKRFATGELIQLTNGQLGVEIRTLWP